MGRLVCSGKRSGSGLWSAAVGAELGQRVGADRQRCVDIAFVGGQRRVVPDDDPVVGAEVQVKLQRGDAQVEGGLEGGQRIFGAQAARAAVALAVEGG